MNHTDAIKTQCRARIRSRLNRPAFTKDVARMRRAILDDNEECFLRRDYPGTIKAIVRYQNIYTVAVLDKATSLVVTVGVQL